MPAEVLNITPQGTRMMLKNITWQLFIQPPEGANMITEGIHINIYFTTLCISESVSHTLPK